MIFRIVGKIQLDVFTYVSEVLKNVQEIDFGSFNVSKFNAKVFFVLLEDSYLYFYFIKLFHALSRVNCGSSNDINKKI